MIELVRANNGSEVGLLHSLQSCYCTFFYEMNRQDMDEQAQKDARRQLEQDRKKRLEIEEERRSKLAREAEAKRTEKARALEKQKAELRAILKHEKAQYKLLKEQGLVSELEEEIKEDIETGRLPHETIKEAQLRHMRALSKLSVAGYGEGQAVLSGVFDDKMLEKDPATVSQGDESSSPKIKSLKATLGAGTENEDMDAAMDNAMLSAMNNLEGDMAVPPPEEEDGRKNKATESLSVGESKESKSPWEDPENFIVYEVDAHGKELTVKDAANAGHVDTISKEIDESDDVDEIRVLWDLEVNDREAEGGVGWTEVLATRFRHDDSPHGSVFLTVDSAEHTVLGWISLSAHDCRLKGVVDEDSHELYDCVNEGLLLDRQTATVTELPPIHEVDEEVDGASTHAAIRPSPSKFQPQEQDFDDDSKGGGDPLPESTLTKEEKAQKLQNLREKREREEEADMSAYKRLQMEAQANIQNATEEKLNKIQTDDDNNSQSPSDGLARESINSVDSDDDGDVSDGFATYKRLQMQAQANIKKSLDEKMKKIDVEGGKSSTITPSKTGLSQKEDDTPAKVIEEAGASKSEEPDATPPNKLRTDGIKSDLEEEDLDI